MDTQIFSANIIPVFQAIMLIIVLTMAVFVVTSMASDDDQYIGTVGHHTWPLENKDLRQYEVKDIIEHDNGDTVMIVERVDPTTNTRMVTVDDRKAFERKEAI